jgi:FkbM family methyltransferase
VELEPLPVVYPTLPPPSGNLLVRGLSSVFVQRQLPYRIKQGVDRLMKAVGFDHRTVTADGLRFTVRRSTWADESIIRHVVENHEYHPPGYEIGPDDLVIDVGANIGTFSVGAARAAVNGWVLAYEPEPENFALLRRNLDRNRCRNVTPVRAAVADATGTRTLRVNADSSGGHALRSDGEPGLTVASVSLKAIFDEYRVERCDYLKLDCEGAEYEILYGLPADYFRRVRRIALEYHADPAEKRVRAGELIRHLRDVGYRIDLYTDIVGSRGGLLFVSREDSTPPNRKTR